MRITVRQLKRLIKEALRDSDIGRETDLEVIEKELFKNPLKQSLFKQLQRKLNTGTDWGDLFEISNVDVLSKYISPELMDKLLLQYSEDEIMAMHADWEWAMSGRREIEHERKLNPNRVPVPMTSKYVYKRGVTLEPLEQPSYPATADDLKYNKFLQKK